MDARIPKTTLFYEICINLLNPLKYLKDKKNIFRESYADLLMELDPRSIKKSITDYFID